MLSSRDDYRYTDVSGVEIKGRIVPTEDIDERNPPNALREENFAFITEACLERGYGMMHSLPDDVTLPVSSFIPHHILRKSWVLDLGSRVRRFYEAQTWFDRGHTTLPTTKGPGNPPSVRQLYEGSYALSSDDCTIPTAISDKLEANYLRYVFHDLRRLRTTWLPPTPVAGLTGGYTSVSDFAYDDNNPSIIHIDETIPLNGYTEEPIALPRRKIGQYYYNTTTAELLRYEKFAYGSTHYHEELEILYDGSVYTFFDAPMSTLYDGVLALVTFKVETRSPRSNSYIILPMNRQVYHPANDDPDAAVVPYDNIVFIPVNHDLYRHILEELAIGGYPGGTNVNIRIYIHSIDILGTYDFKSNPPSRWRWTPPSDTQDSSEP